MHYITTTTTTTMPELYLVCIHGDEEHAAQDIENGGGHHNLPGIRSILQQYLIHKDYPTITAKITDAVSEYGSINFTRVEYKSQEELVAYKNVIKFTEGGYRPRTIYLVLEGDIKNDPIPAKIQKFWDSVHETGEFPDDIQSEDDI